MDLNAETQAVRRARQSGGFSGGDLFYEFVIRGQENVVASGGVLDLGCGRGGFGHFLQNRFGVRPTGVDLFRYADFAEPSYESLIVSDLDPLEAGVLTPGWTSIFAIGLLEYLTNPRALIQAAARLLAPGGRLVITSPNPFSLRSLFTALRTGEFSAFREATNPASITPVVAVDAARMLREAGLQNVELCYSNRGSLPALTGLTWQRLVPHLAGRWFSDDFRIIGIRTDQTDAN